MADYTHKLPPLNCKGDILYGRDLKRGALPIAICYVFCL